MNATDQRQGRAVDALLDTLPPLCVVVGKGGVGKTTCAVGLTAHYAARRERTLLVSTDPAGSLGTVLGIDLAPGEQRHTKDLPGCTVLQLDARMARREFLARSRQVLVTIVDRGTYLDEDDVEGLVDAAFPGADEIFAVLRLAELIVPSRDPNWEHIIVDTAPTGHTLRLLALPESFEAMIALLDAMQEKHRFMVTALTHRYRSDDADAFLASMRDAIGGLRSSLSDRRRCGAVLVTRAERVVVRETQRYARELDRLHLAVLTILVNALTEPLTPDGQHALSDLAAIGPALVGLPQVDPPPRGVADIGPFMERLRVICPQSAREESMPARSKRLRRGRRSEVSSFSGGAPHAAVFKSLLRTLTIVGGKGGVGKTTVSCALALAAVGDSERTSHVLLVSTDPAPSIGDAFGIVDSAWARNAPEALPELSALEVWQMDATTAFDSVRDRYKDRIDELFDAFTGRGIDASRDRAILRDLLALAPPGIDELYALAALGEILEEKRYSCIVVDPAPTGHLLRLLEMPAIALDWTHRLMRLILKYREVAPLGDAAQELVNFSRRTRALDQLLHDPARAGIVLVSLNEPIVRAESERLTKELRNAGVALLGIVWNRLQSGAEPASSDALPRHSIFAQESASPLVGRAAIADWSRRWQQRD